LTRYEVLSTLSRFDDRKEERADEADVSAECTPPEEDARLPRADEDKRRAEGVEATAREGAETADRLTGPFPRRERLTTGADFQALFQRGKRIDRPSMIVLWRESTAPRRAGFAVSRQVRTAVQKNRARRRLREAYRLARDAAPASIALVIIAKPGALRERFGAIAEELRGAFAAIPGPRA
jgi:ribonuclease P protein component